MDLVLRALARMVAVVGLTPLIERLLRPAVERQVRRFDRRAVKRITASLFGDGARYPAQGVPGHLLVSADRLLWQAGYGGGTLDLGAAGLDKIRIVPREGRSQVWTFDVTARDRDGAHLTLTVTGRWWLGSRLPTVLRVGGHGGRRDPVVVAGPDHRLRSWWPPALLVASVLGLCVVVGPGSTGAKTTGTVVSTYVKRPGRSTQEHRFCVVDFVDPGDGRLRRDATDCDDAGPGDVIAVTVLGRPWSGRLQSSDVGVDEFILALAGAATGAGYTIRRSVFRRRMREVHESKHRRGPTAVGHRPAER